MAQRIVILSDTHMAHPRTRVGHPAQLQPLWQGADELIINGDVAEVRHEQQASAAIEKVQALRERCTADGVRLTLLAGNHDPQISPCRHRFLADRHVFVTHGDAFHRCIAPWGEKAECHRRTYEEVLHRLSGHRHDPLHIRLTAAREATLRHWHLPVCHPLDGVLGFLRRPTAAFKVIHYWRTIPHLAARFTAQFAHPARFVVFGHSHWPGVWRIGEHVVINTGSFQGLEARPRAVILEPGQISIHRIHERCHRFQPTDRPLARFELPEVALNSIPVPASGSTFGSTLGTSKGISDSTLGNSVGNSPGSGSVAIPRTLSPASPPTAFGR